VVGAAVLAVLAAAALTGCMEVGGSTPTAPGAVLPQDRPSLGPAQNGLLQTRAGARHRGGVPLAPVSPGPSVSGGSSDGLVAGKPLPGASAGLPGGAASAGSGAAGGAAGAPGGGSGGGANGGGAGGSSGESPSATAGATPTLPPPPPVSGPPTTQPPASSPSVSASAGPTP